MMTDLDTSVNKLNSYSFSYTKPADVCYLVGSSHRKNRNRHADEEDYERVTDNKLAKSKDLRERLYKEKRDMVGRTPG